MKHLFTFMILVILFTACSKQSNNTPPPPPADTKLKLTVFDKTLNTTSAGATVRLYTSLESLQSQTGAIAIKTTNTTGEVIFTGLQHQIYYWYAENGCRTNTFESNTTNGAITSMTTTSLVTAINSTGTLRFVNNFSSACRIDVNGVTLVNALSGSTTYNIKMGTGFYDIRVIRLAGGFDQTYTGTLTCGNMLITTIP